jgi:hypothetical protein
MRRMDNQMPRMEDKIRRLCSELLAARADEEVRGIVVELRDALHEYVDRLRERFRTYPFVVERRARNDIQPVNKQGQDDDKVQKTNLGNTGT